jgi:hypothetical protein
MMANGRPTSSSSSSSKSSSKSNSNNSHKLNGNGNRKSGYQKKTLHKSTTVKNENSGNRGKQATLFSFWAKQPSDNTSSNDQTRFLPQGIAPPPPPPSQHAINGKKRSLVALDKSLCASLITSPRQHDDDDDTHPEAVPSIPGTAETVPATQAEPLKTETARLTPLSSQKEDEIESPIQRLNNVHHNDSDGKPSDKDNDAGMNTKRVKMTTRRSHPSPDTNIDSTPTSQNQPTNTSWCNGHKDRACSSDQDEESEQDSGNDSDDTNDPELSSPVVTKTSQEEEDGLSDYERLRLRNIARNQARLEALGLVSGNNNGGRRQPNNPPPRPRKRRNLMTVSSPALATTNNNNRRSRRLMQQKNGPEAGTTTEQSEVIATRANDQNKSSSNDNLEHEQVELSFEVSHLVQYAMMGSSTTSTPATIVDGSSRLFGPTWDSEDESSMSCLGALYHEGRRSPCRLVGPMGAIYSLNFWKGPKHENHLSTTTTTNNNNSHLWLVGAGKSGVVAIWDCANALFGHDGESTAPPSHDGTFGTRSTYHDDWNDNGGASHPLASWKAHSGRWIADAQFLSLGGGGGTDKPCPAPVGRLVSAGNDGTVCLWDLSSQSRTTGAPRLLAQSNKQLHTSGIFCMDLHTSCTVSSTMIGTTLMATGSKDKTIAVTDISNNANDTSCRCTATLPIPIWRSTFHTAKVTAVQWQSVGSTSAPCNSTTGTPLLASASDDGQVAVHDCRVNGNTITSPLVIAASHQRPHSVVWDPNTSYGLLTGTHGHDFLIP